jgi:hypothetical protein
LRRFCWQWSWELNTWILNLRLALSSQLSNLVRGTESITRLLFRLIDKGSEFSFHLISVCCFKLTEMTNIIYLRKLDFILIFDAI